jgi:diazepam-binding inhibitor (GABA receptor modulator, acyl-CoA-binding protein)
MLGNIRRVKARLYQAMSLRMHRVTSEETAAMATSKLKTQFDKAVAESKQLSAKPDNNTLLKIYSLYKQATEGDCEGKRPGMLDMVGRAKFDAWAALKGTSADDAMKDYVALINSLK